MKRLLLALLCIFFASSIKAQDSTSYRTVGLVIVHSTKDFNAAVKAAHEASKTLKLELSIEGDFADPEIGLDNDSEFGHMPRGRWDDGEYVSIEWSNDYNGFAEGYYIVVVASKPPEDLVGAISVARDHYPDAYLKEAEVYIGCAH